MNTVNVVGSINIDIVATANRHPQVGETISGDSLAHFPGGKGANQAVASARLGARTVMVGAVGDDSAGESLLAFLKENRVDTSRINTVRNETTGTALIVVANADNMIVVVPGANGMVTPQAVDYLGDEHSPIVLAQFETPLDTTVAAFRNAKAQSGMTILNPAPFTSIPGELLAMTDYLVVNETELESASIANSALTHPDDYTAAANSILTKGPHYVVLTLGSKGVRVYGAGESFAIEGHAVSAVDSTGAGDCFCGALAAALARGDTEPRTAAEFANAAAAISVQRAGAGPSMPSLDEVKRFLS